MRKKAALAALGFFCLPLTGCNTFNEVAHAVLPQVCKAFPDSVLYRIGPRVLWVQTRVDGISSETALSMFRETCAEAPWHIGKITINITTEMNLAHKQYLVMGFRRFFVAWNVADGVDARGIPRAQVFTLQQANDWFYRVLGSAPSTNQIYVVTLSDVQNATGNQLIQGRPLSDFQNEAKQNQQK